MKARIYMLTGATVDVIFDTHGVVQDKDLGDGWYTFKTTKGRPIAVNLSQCIMVEPLHD